MGHIVSGDLYRELDQKLFEIKRQILQKGGYFFDPDRLNNALQTIIDGRFERYSEILPSVISSPADLIPDNWTVLEDVPKSKFNIGALKPRSFLKNEETIISGFEMLKRAVELSGNLGLADGSRMLAKQDKIPADFRHYCIPLPGTILRDISGYRRIVSLSFFAGRWNIGYDYLGRDWYSHDRLACKTDSDSCQK